MAERELTAGCSTDVSVSFAESLHVYPGLLTVATVCGALSGILAAALLYVFCLKPLLLTTQGYNARRLFEPDDGGFDNNQSDNNSRKEAPSGTANDKEKKQPMNSDVAAFASRAKVVYPINQKYRPLADGASNPSLHEHSKLPSVPNEESSSAAGESLSQERDNDDSSHFISSSVVPKSLQNQSVTRVSHYPQTLTLTGFEGRISLYCLALRDIQQHYDQLQEEKCVLFLEMVKIVLRCNLSKDKKEADVSRVLQMQEKQLDELKKQLLTGQRASEKIDDAPCTMEEIERAQKDHLEHSLQMSKGFSQQVEDLCQHLLKNTSIFSPDEAQVVITSLVKNLLLVENLLMNVQETDLIRTQQKVLWWEELRGLLQSQPAMLRQEVCLRLGLITNILEQLTSDDLLSFSSMEKVLSDVQTTLTDGLQQCTEECTRKLKELVNMKCSKIESKQKKFLKCQIKEKSRFLELSQSHNDLEEFTKMYQELLMKHKQQISELQMQQDDSLAEVLCDLWTKLRTSWSKRFGELSKDTFFTCVHGHSEVSAEHCEKLWLDLEQQLAAQLQQAEGVTKQHLEDMTAQLFKDVQVLSDETAVMLACLKHLSEEQMKILRAMVVRQSYALNSLVGMLLEKKHEHLLVAMQRCFIVRHFSLHLLKEMRLSKLKVLCQTDVTAVLTEDPSNSQQCASATLKNSTTSLAEKHLGPESQLLTHTFQQEFLSELETGTELLQTHAQLVLGNALSHAIRQMMQTSHTGSQTYPGQNNGLKCRLIEAVSESVYVTRDSLSALVQSYYSHLHNITRNLQHELSNITQEEEKQDGSNELNKVLLRELVKWGKKPVSAEFQQRVALQKRRVLEHCDLEQKTRYEELRNKKVTLDQTLDRVKVQLLEAEEAFISELSALARVALHTPDPDSSGQEDNGNEGATATILDLLARNPALDPNLNPSLTPTVVTPAIKSTTKKKRECESHHS